MGRESETLVAVLAAGAARRMGSPKQLCRVGGKTLIEGACAVAASAGSVLAVVGSSAGPVAGLARAAGAQVAFNPAWQSGQASSVRVAAAWAQRWGFGALALMPVDMPLLSAGHLQALVDALRFSERPVAASRSTKGLVAPCAFHRCMFDKLQTLQGDRGAVALVRRCAAEGLVAAVAFASEDMLFDVDTPADLARARRALEREGKRCGNLR